MVIPPSAATQALIAAAQTTGFALPRCRACGHRFYPAQSFCPHCLAPEIEYAADDGGATVLSTTRIHRSLDAAFSQRLPVHVAQVRTHTGPSLFVMVDRWLPAGTPVRVRLHQGLFHADDLTR